MKKIGIDIRRKIIQIAAFGFTNTKLANFPKGKIYTGNWKRFCNPGLNCYSCPAATYACPIGAMQADLRLCLSVWTGAGADPFHPGEENKNTEMDDLYKICSIGSVCDDIACCCHRLYGDWKAGASVCKMDVNPVKQCDSAECIRCGKCVESCPTGAIKLGFHK